MFGSVDLAEATTFLREPGVVPSRVLMAGPEPLLMLVDAGTEPFTGGFLEESIGRALGTNGGFARRVRAPLSVLDAPIAFDDPVPLAGILFHVSRCGSTIPVRICQADPTTNVVSEAEPVDVVVTRLPVDHETRVRMLRNVVATYARRRTNRTARLVLKLDAWHLTRHRLFREAFPGVPQAVILRDPLDVVLSHTRRRGSHMVPGQYPRSLFDIESDEFEPHELDRYTALVLRSLYRHAAMAAEEGALLVRYPDLPAAAFDSILPAFGISLDAQARRSVEWLRTQHAKMPDQAFDADTEARLNRPSDAQRALVDSVARPAYDALTGL